MPWSLTAGLVNHEHCHSACNLAAVRLHNSVPGLQIFTKYLIPAKCNLVVDLSHNPSDTR